MQDAPTPAIEQEARVARARRAKRIRRTLLVLGLLLAVGGGGYGIARYIQRQSLRQPGAIVPDQGREHVALNAPFSYNSNPPTSGPHYGASANWGVYDYEVNDKIFIHNLEHGGVWISYRPDLPTDVIGQLKGIVDEFGGSKLVMAPRAANDSDVAVAAWGRLLKLSLADGRLSDDSIRDIRDFYRAYKNRGPEFIPDLAPGIDPKSVQ